MDFEAEGQRKLEVRSQENIVRPDKYASKMLWTVENLLLFWHVPLGVHSAIRRHQPPQRAVLSQIDCFFQCKVVG